MDCPKLYIDWINYLRKHKLYGAWIKDIVTYVEYTTDLVQEREQEIARYEPIRDVGGGWWFNFNPQYAYTDTTVDDPNLKSYCLGNKKSINRIISNFSMGSNYIKVFMSSMRYTINSICYKYRVSNVHWNDIYEQFMDERQPKLSVTLSRRMARRANKTVSYNYKEKVEQPWYSKSYEKYNRKAWRK